MLETGIISSDLNLLYLGITDIRRTIIYKIVPDKSRYNLIPDLS